MRATLSAVALSSVLAACGQGQERTITSAEGGEQATVATGATAAVDLPDYAPAYPGATIQSSMTAASMGGGETGGMVTMVTDDDRAQVTAFYRARFSTAGLGEMQVTEGGGATIISAGRADGGDRGAQVTLATADGGRTQITLMYGAG